VKRAEETRPFSFVRETVIVPSGGHPAAYPGRDGRSLFLKVLNAVPESPKAAGVTEHSVAHAGRRPPCVSSPGLSWGEAAKAIREFLELNRPVLLVRHAT
jgi:hypothetical protein